MAQPNSLLSDKAQNMAAKMLRAPAVKEISASRLDKALIERAKEVKRDVMDAGAGKWIVRLFVDGRRQFVQVEAPGSAPIYYVSTVEESLTLRRYLSLVTGE